MWYKFAAQGIIQHQTSDQEIDSLVDQSLIDNGEKYLIDQIKLKNGLMSMFPSLKDVLFEDSANSVGEYILELSAIAIPTEITKNQVQSLKATLHHELQHAEDPRMQKMPEKVKQLSDEANLANYIVGACYFHIKEYDKAIKYLKEFDGNGADQIQSRAYLLIGHANSEKNNTAEALNYYKKAAEVNEKDEYATPDALMVYAAYAEQNGKNEEAIAAYKKVKNNFPTFPASSNGDVEKRLARLGELNP
jgi:tetratricopeptide (TPR) repeat protein